MEPADQRPPKRTIFDQCGPEQKKLSSFDQKLYSRSPPTPIPKIPISKSAPVSPIEEGTGSFVRDPPSSERLDDPPARFDRENAPDALGISGLDLKKLDSFSMDINSSKLPIGADAVNTGKTEGPPRGSPPPRLSVRPDIFPIPELLQTPTTVKSTRVEWGVDRNGKRLLQPREFDLKWARDLLLPIDRHGRVPVLTQPFDFAENVKFIPMNKPYAERLDKPYYSPAPDIEDYDFMSDHFLPGFPFFEGYPYAGNITLRHLHLRQLIVTYRNQKVKNMTNAQRQAFARSQAQDYARQMLSTPDVNRQVDLAKRSQLLNPSLIHSNMQFLLNDSPPVSDQNFAALHYAPGEQAKLKVVQENLLSTNPDQGNNTKRHYPTHDMPRFLQQRAEIAVAAERHEEVPLTEKLTYIDYDEMDNKTVIVKTKEQVTIDYHELLKKDNRSWQEMYTLGQLEVDHDENLKDCLYCSQSKPSFGIDPPNPTWTTDASKKPMPREGEEDLIFGNGEEDWEAAFIDYGDESQYSGLQDMNIDHLMDGQ